MSTIFSIPTTVTVSDSRAMALDAVAAAMPPGTWAQVTPANDQNAFLGVRGASGVGGSGTMLHYANNCAWNRLNRCIEIVGADHGYGATQRYVRYDTATNQFILVNVGGDGSDSGLGPGHEFAGLAVNPHNGDVYYRHYGSYQLGFYTVTMAALNGVSFSTSVRNTPATLTNVNTGTAWWSGAFDGAGSHGCLILFNSGNANGSANDGHMMAYDPLANSWFYNQTGMAPFYTTHGTATYHEVCAYSPVKNCMVYGGGHSEYKRLVRLNSDRSRTEMPTLPGGDNVHVGIQHGNLVCDPVTGNFLLLSAGQLWELNPSGSGAWTQQTGSRVPPSDVGIPGPPAVRVDGVVSCAIPEHGVVAYIKQSSPSGGTFYLYKHA